MIRCKRAYESAAAEDGTRILVERLWPRGCARHQLSLQGWNRDVAPSTQLRHAFKQGELDFDTFRSRYCQELAGRPEHWMPLLDAARNGDLTLIHAARDSLHNSAQVLAQWLEDELDRDTAPSSPVCYADPLNRQ